MFDFHITEKRTDLILNYLIDKHDMDSCGSYGEQGYTDPESGILFCDWNPISTNICDYLEEAGYNLEWSDEWYIDHDHDKAWRTSPDSYGWICAIHVTEYGDVLTPDDSVSEWVEEMLITDYCQPMRALPDWISAEDIQAEGFTLIDQEYESGWHHGQDDDPETIARDLLETYENVLFQIDSSGQFDIRFIVYVGEVR